MIYSVADGIVIAGLVITAAMAIGMIATNFIFVGCTIALREHALQFFLNARRLRESGRVVGSKLSVRS
jgi:hypothetical protein